MNFTPLITIIISVVAIYFFVKLIVNPLIKVVAGVVIFLVIVYILQRFFNFDFNDTFGPLAKYLNPEKWGVNFNEIISQIVNYIKGLLFKK